MSELRKTPGRESPAIELTLAHPSARGFAAWLAARAFAGASILALVALAELTDGARGAPLSFSSVTLLILGGLVVLSSAGFGWLARTGSSRRTLALPIVLMDLAVIAALVYLTGGAASIFASLFGVVILLAALLLGPEAALVTTAAALAVHVFVALGLSASIFPRPPDAPRGIYELSPLAVSIALSGHASALLIVGLLSRALAIRVRRAGGDVERAQASAAQLERLNAAIVQGIGSGLVTLDAEGRVQSVNPAAQRIFGAPEAALIGAEARSLLPLEGLTLPLERVERREGDGWRAGGEAFLCGLTASQLADRDRERTLIVFQDLSQIRELKRVAARAEQFASLGRIAASLAHEIRNPLGAISGSVQMVRETASLDEDDEKLLAIVSREVERLDELVASMLAASRPESRPSRRWIELDAVVADVVALIGRGPLAASKGRVVVRGAREVRVRADDQQLRQILWNLIKNALVVSPAGEPVEIHVERLDAGARIAIDDAGPGLPPEARARVFEPFYSGRPLGVGLGLSIVDQLVRAHGGHVEVTESPLGGARFLVDIPDES